MVSTLSLICMAVSAVLSIGLPITLFILWRKRTGAKPMAAVAGAITFLVFVYGLENGMHQACIYGDNAVSRFILGTDWAYVLYAGLAAGLFEETGRFLTMKVFLKLMNKKHNGVMYGIGHGGIESILVAGLTMIVSLVLAFRLNAGGADALLALAPGEEAAMTATITAITDTPSAMFLVSALERCIAIALHIALSVFVFLAAKRKGKLYLYPVAVLLHTAVDCVASLFHVGVLTSILWVEVIVFVMTAGIVLWAFRLYQADQDPEPPAPASEPQTFGPEKA